MENRQSLGQHNWLSTVKFILRYCGMEEIWFNPHTVNNGSIAPKCSVILTLPVRRYLVLTPSTKGGGGGSRPPPPMISKTVDSTNFNFGRPLGLSMRGKKPVELMI